MLDTEDMIGNHPIQPGEFDDSKTMHEDCVRLWCAALMAGLDDALRQRGNATYNRDSVPVARGWFGTADFRETCWCAGFDPRIVMDFYQKRLEIGLAGDWAAAREGIRAGGKGLATRASMRRAARRMVA